MNPEWDTPPNGDFARYVERLTAQMALPRPEVQQAPNVIDDVVERPGLGGRQAAVPATAAADTRPALLAIDGKLLRGAVGGLVLLLVVLHLVFNVSVFVLLIVAAAFGYVAFMLRGALSGKGAAALRQRIENAAREAGRRS